MGDGGWAGPDQGRPLTRTLPSPHKPRPRPGTGQQRAQHPQRTLSHLFHLPHFDADLFSEHAQRQHPHRIASLIHQQGRIGRRACLPVRGVVHMDTSTLRGIPGPRCCCGSADCAFLAHNGRLLEGLERDVSKAAQLGQVCAPVTVVCRWQRCRPPPRPPRLPLHVLVSALCH